MFLPQLSHNLCLITCLYHTYVVVWSTELRQSRGILSGIWGNATDSLSQPIEFLKSEDDDAWAALEAMRWQRATSWDDNKALMMKRLGLLRKMIRSSDQLKYLWSQEIDRLKPLGIVMTAGGQEQLTNAYASMVVLRNVTQSTLPVAICHFGDEISEKSKAFIKSKISYVEFIDLANFPFPSYHLPVFDGHGAPRSREEGYQVKLLALRAAPFREIVFIDVDSFPLEKPESLFKYSKYVERGNMFWPDLWRGQSNLYDFLGIKTKSPWHPKGGLDPWRDRVGKYFDPDTDGRDTYGIDSETLPTHQTEAGQFVLNREKHWDVLEYLLLINMHYNLTYHVEANLGDKDTFRVAFALAGKAKDFYQVPIGPSAALIDFEKHGLYGENPRYKTLGNVQLHPHGHMVFHHKTIEKIPAQGDPGYRVWPIDLVTAPLSDMQARNMLEGGSEWRSLHKGWLNWGFIDYDIKYFVCGFNCSCNVNAMHKVEKKCTGKSEGQKEIFDYAFPVTGVKLPDGHLAQKASAILADAVKSLPEGGI